MPHNRKLVVGTVALTMARIPAKKRAASATRVRDELEEEMILSGYLENAPFKWVGVMIREGLINEVKPHYNRINKKYGDLPLAIEVDVHNLIDVSEDEISAVYRKATLIALVHAGEKYRLKTDRMRELLEKS